VNETEPEENEERNRVLRERITTERCIAFLIFKGIFVKYS